MSKDIVIKQPEQILWEKVRDETKELIEQHSNALIIQKEVLNLANIKLKFYE